MRGEPDDDIGLPIVQSDEWVSIMDTTAFRKIDRFNVFTTREKEPGLQLFCNLVDRLVVYFKLAL